MLPGFASRATTAALAQKNERVAFNQVGPRKLSVSQAGFGCYRISAGVKTHAEALRLALSSGINLIDTSTNYTDGGSELLVGQVLKSMIAAGTLARDQVVVVSKVGYLQGRNLALSREKRAGGSPFKDLVEYHPDLEHCVHPEFIADQLTRSLERLGLATLDCYLLHNPEYYLEWAQKSQIPLEQARREYYRRIQLAFEHLETEVAGGRIRAYGISSNTFPSTGQDPEFTSLEKIWEIATGLAGKHHFEMVQMPLNILEKGAVLEQNQTHAQSSLAFAQAKGLGVLINRPLNAFDGNSLVRLVDMKRRPRQAYEEIIRKIRAVIKSETRLWKRLLPKCDFIPEGVRIRIKDQLAVGDTLKHYWKNFGSYERWRQTKNSSFLPRVQGVFDYLAKHAAKNADLEPWIDAHTAHLSEAFAAVASLYSEAAARRTADLKQDISRADSDWNADGSLSQKAIRAIRSTFGVSSVLVGMRREAYVENVLEELGRPVPVRERQRSWELL
ncbi:MAG: aldo/keto reductase [Desulfobacterales bacterium]|nr:aldo/keto reductase [Desulfobacterales bacterium]